MKFLVSLFLTALFAFALGLYLDWWSIAIAAFVVALCIPLRPGFSFLAGFLALLLLWGGYSIFLNQRNAGILATKIASVLPMQGNVTLLIFVTALLGALVAGFAALSAGYLRQQLFNQNNPITFRS